MLKFVSSVCAAAIAVTAPFIGAAGAMPLSSPQWDRPAVTLVQDGQSGSTYTNPRIEGWRADHGIRGDFGDNNRRWRRYRDWDDVPRYRGHRGYRHYRDGYRSHGGFWYPPAAFIAGAIIGGALANQEPRYRPRGSAHVDWCYDRYRSYRASDNTYQPYNGPRRQCRSPYG
jgi:hypothetical protein